MTCPCAICLDTVSQPATATPCGHCFDYLCILHWLQERPICPLCNSPVQSVSCPGLSCPRPHIYNVPTREDTRPLRSIPRPRSGPAWCNRSRYRQRSARPTPRPDAVEALQRRKDVYRRQLYSCHVGSNRISRFRELTPQLAASDEELITRARKWIRRELQVFDFLGEGTSGATTRRVSNAEFLLGYIISILKTVDIKGSGGQAEDLLQEFLGRDNARLFLHELRAWLRSPFINLQDWDRNVQYLKTSMTSYAT